MAKAGAIAAEAVSARLSMDFGLMTLRVQPTAGLPSS
jgi:hypothetical protein